MNRLKQGRKIKINSRLLLSSMNDLELEKCILNTELMVNSCCSKSVANMIYGKALTSIISECAKRVNSKNETILRIQNMVIDRFLKMMNLD